MTTIEVMRKALEALRGAGAELSSVLAAINDERMPHDGDEFHERLGACISVSAALRAELARLEGVEPVAWMRPDNRVAEESYARTQFSRGADKPPIGTWVPLYTAPIAPAVPALTDDEVEATYQRMGSSAADDMRWAYALAAERAGARIKEDGQ